MAKAKASEQEDGGKGDEKVLDEIVLEPRLEDDSKRLLDELIVPFVTPSDKKRVTIARDILEQLEEIIKECLVGDGSGEMNSVKLLLGVRKTMKVAEKLIMNGEERKEAIIYVCKVAILRNATNRVVRDTMLLLVDDIVPEVIEMVVDVVNDPKAFAKKGENLFSKLCLCK